MDSKGGNASPEPKRSTPVPLEPDPVSGVRRTDAPDQISSTVRDTRMNRIAARAHQIYQARGGEHGKALEDWLQAEREIDADLD